MPPRATATANTTHPSGSGEASATPDDGKAIWNERYLRRDLVADREGEWLERWHWTLDAGGGRALDLGCGEGADAEVLSRWGLDVTGVDLSEVAVVRARARLPSATFRTMDLRDLSSLDGSFRFVAASLSLHYFERADTIGVFRAIERLLAPGGVFAFRVNAYDDIEHGALSDCSSWGRVEVQGVHKQFFTESKLAEVLAGAPWQVVFAEKGVVLRHGRPKSLFEVVVRKDLKESK